MFRKRIAAAGVLIAATLGTVALFAPSASAQVIDMDDEDDVPAAKPKGKAPAKAASKPAAKPAAAAAGGVIDLDDDSASGGGGVAATAGEPTEAMARAKSAFDQKKWAQAAEGMYDVVAGTTGDDAGNKQLAEFYLAQSLYFLSFYQASFDSFAKIADNPQHLKFNETILWMAKLSIDLPEPADIIAHVGKFSEEELARFDNATQKEVYWKLNYLLGRYKYRENDFEDAIKFFQRVDSRGDDYVAAQFFTGVSYIQLKKAVAAVKSFQRVETAVDEGAKVDDANRMRDLARLSMARTMYSSSIQLDPETNVPEVKEDHLSAAVKYWNEVDESSEYWLDAHFEEAWAYYMAGQYTRALGNIHTLKSPYFPSAFYPEADILKAIVFFFNCDYESATTVVARFNTKTTPIKDKLEAILKKYQGDGQSEAFYKLLVQVREGNSNIDPEVEPLVKAALSDRQLLRNIGYVEFLEKEENHFKEAPPGFKSSSVGGYVDAKIKESRATAVKNAGDLAKQRYQRYVDEMGEHLRNGEKILIDITAAQRNLLDQAIKEGQVSAVDAQTFGVVNPDDEHFRWPFDGEYWRDELGFYRQEVKSACGR
jgi:tetratricopeptide (TPR) repeat protein